MSATASEMGEGKGYEWLRHSAGLEYITNLHGVSIRDLHHMSPYDQVNERTLARWSTEDDWVQRRQRYFQEITHEAEKRLKEKVVQARVRQLVRTEEIANSVAEEILSGDVEAKSKEGLITALVRLLDLNETTREKITSAIVPEHLGGVGPQETIPVMPELTSDEARAAATSIVRVRRAKAREKIRIEAASKKKTGKKPNLRVVRGNGDG